MDLKNSVMQRHLSPHRVIPTSWFEHCWIDTSLMNLIAGNLLCHEQPRQGNSSPVNRRILDSGLKRHTSVSDLNKQWYLDRQSVERTRRQTVHRVNADSQATQEQRKQLQLEEDRLLEQHIRYEHLRSNNCLISNYLVNTLLINNQGLLINKPWWLLSSSRITLTWHPDVSGPNVRGQTSGWKIPKGANWLSHTSGRASGSWIAI